MSVTISIVVVGCIDQGQPAFCATWAAGIHQGHAISHCATQAAILARYRLGSARRAAAWSRACRFGSFAHRCTRLSYARRTRPQQAIVCAACGCDSNTDPFRVGCDCVWSALHQAQQAAAHV